MKLESLSIPELKQLQIDIEQEIEGRKNQERVNTLNEIRLLAEAKGYSLEELVGASPRKSSKPSSKKTVPVKFRHPSNASLAWTGRGRTPKWISEWEAAGNSMDTLRVS